jgi:carbon-monoxide dehydrogenase large subunit
MAATETQTNAEVTQYVGQSVPRVEDQRFLTGRARYTHDIALPGMLFAAFLRSPLAHATIVSIDTTKARQAEGVLGVWTGHDLAEELGKFTTTLPRPEVKVITRELLPTDRVRFVGQALAVVVGRSRYLAEDACELIDVEYEELPVVLDPEQAISKDATLIYPELESNNFGHIEFDSGKTDELFASADRVFRKKFHHGRFMAAPLETRGIVASYDPGSGEYTMYNSTQMPHLLRTQIAPVLGVQESKLRIIADSVGGGFGMKCQVFEEDVIIPTLARLLGKPVKWIEDRLENLAASMHAKEQVCDVEIAAKADGTFLAFRGWYLGVAGAYPGHPWTSHQEPLCAAQLLPSLYDVGAVSYKVDDALTNRCPVGSYRGVGWTAGHVARETLIDDVARELGIDPVELRLRNLIPDAPFQTVTGMRYDGGSYRKSMLTALDAIDYDGFRKRQEELRQQGRYIGIGVSPFVEPTAWGSDIAAANGFTGAEFFDAASVTVEPDGSVTVRTGLHNHGQAHETTLAQVAADTVGVSLDAVRVIENDSGATVYGGGTYASRSAVIGTGTIMRAGAEVRSKLIRLAAHALEVGEDDVEISGGSANVKGVPGKGMTIAELAGLAYYGGDARPEDMEPALTAVRTYDPPETYSNGTFVVAVEVDVETGVVRIERIVACEDCGVMLNPKVVEGQVHGAIAQGIGGAMFEDLPYDAEGQLMAGTLADYLYPGAQELPHMEVHHIETPSVVTDGGVKGVGESGVIAVGAALVNAISDALGPLGPKPVTKTPLRPEDVLELLDGGSAGANGAGG